MHQPWLAIGLPLIELVGQLWDVKNIVSFVHTQITKHQVDRFVPGRRVPSCQLYVKWTGQQQQPVELVHRVELLGAKEPFNFFLIRPPSLPKLPQGMYTDALEQCVNIPQVCEN